MPRTAALVLCACAVASGATAQGVIRGVAYDSLIGAPLVGAEVWLRGVERRALTDSAGAFQLDSIPAGRYTVALDAPGLDSAGIYALTAAVTVAGADTARVSFTVPSLATVWRQRCAARQAAGSDSGIVFGIVDDAATGAHLAGAGVFVSWLDLVQQGRTEVRGELHDARVVTDSIGAYFACGVSRQVTVRLRAYAHSDSTGLIDVHLATRAIARRDFSLGVAGAATVLRGVARTTEGQPLGGARVVVREAAATLTRPDGSFLLTDLPEGTQWLSVQAIGREPVEQAVVLRIGDTTTVVLNLGPLPVTLEAIQVVAALRSRAMLEFEERRRLGMGYAFTQEQLARSASIRSILSAVPSVTIIAGPTSGPRVYLPSPGIGRSQCLAALYIDRQRADYDELQAFRPEDLVGVEIYERASTVPAQFQPVPGGCGVVLVWTKYLR